MLSALGLHDLAPEALTFSAPGMVDSELVQQILPKLEPRMEKALEAKGFVVLNWVQVGTVAVFCNKPYATPEAAAEAKFFAWDGDPNAVAAFQAIGWRPVVLSATDIATSLQTGMITCITQAPAYMLATRIFERTPAMVDFPWSYLIAATVVKREAWEQIPVELRPKLLALAREAGAQLDSNLKKLNADAVEAMQRQGLKVVKVDAAVWQKAAERSWPAVRGKVVPADFFDEVKGYREAARAAHLAAPH
jgi:TRAP-type C4-dicarboxylate transport system substrate-binding protein